MVRPLLSPSSVPPPSPSSQYVSPATTTVISPSLLPDGNAQTPADLKLIERRVKSSNGLLNSLSEVARGSCYSNQIPSSSAERLIKCKMPYASPDTSAAKVPRIIKSEPRTRIVASEPSSSGGNSSRRGGNVKGHVFTSVQTDWVVTQLQEPEVYVVLQGERDSTTQKTPKTRIYERLAQKFNEHFRGVQVGHDQIKNKIAKMKAQFKDADEKRNASGFGSTDDEHWRNIILEVCPFYFVLEDTWHAYWGNLFTHPVDSLSNMDDLLDRERTQSARYNPEWEDSHDDGENSQGNAQDEEDEKEDDEEEEGEPLIRRRPPRQTELIQRTLTPAREGRGHHRLQQRSQSKRPQQPSHIKGAQQPSPAAQSSVIAKRSVNSEKSSMAGALVEFTAISRDSIELERIKLELAREELQYKKEERKQEHERRMAAIKFLDEEKKREHERMMAGKDTERIESDNSDDTCTTVLLSRQTKRARFDDSDDYSQFLRWKKEREVLRLTQSLDSNDIFSKVSGDD